jgi:hypothetical protein
MGGMSTTQFGGPIGPFLDNVQQRGVPVNVEGTCDYQASGPVADPAGLDNEVRQRLLWAVKSVIGQRMGNGQLTFRNLGEGTLGDADAEIVGATGLAQMGVNVGNLAMRFAIDGGPPQREVRARIHLGGLGALGSLNIKVSSSGGVDTAHLGKQLADKAKSAVLWYVITGLVVLAIVGGVVFYLKRTVKKALDQPSATAVAAQKWDGKSPLTCGGNDVVTIDGVTAKLDGTAVTAGGNCKLTLTNVNLAAPTGIEAGGSAIVTVSGGSIAATVLAVHAMGGAQVHLTGTKVTGKTEKLGGAAITGP